VERGEKKKIEGGGNKKIKINRRGSGKIRAPSSCERGAQQG